MTKADRLHVSFQCPCGSGIVDVVWLSQAILFHIQAMKPCLSLCSIVGPAQKMECALGPLGMDRALFCLLAVAAGSRRLLCLYSGEAGKLPLSLASPFLASEEQSSRPVKWQMSGREKPGLCSLSFPI